MLRNIVVAASAIATLASADTVYLNSVTDFCLWAPPPGQAQPIGNAEAFVVSYCTQSGKGSNTMPAGTIKSAHWVETPDYIMITGTLDGTKISIPADDEGGELDPHGATNEGNPIGGKLVTAKWGGVKEWHSFISGSEYCIKGCKDSGDSWLRCQHIYDTEGCYWNMPGDYSSGFTSCQGDSDGYPGIVGSGAGASTFHHGDAVTPAARPAGKTSNCQTVATVGNGVAAPAAAPTTSNTPVPAASAITSSVAASPSDSKSQATASGDKTQAVASGTASSSAGVGSAAQSSATPAASGAPAPSGAASSSPAAVAAGASSIAIPGAASSSSNAANASSGGSLAPGATSTALSTAQSSTMTTVLSSAAAAAGAATSVGTTTLTRASAAPAATGAATAQSGSAAALLGAALAAMLAL